MEAPVVSALAAVFGSLVGGSATVVTAWISQKTNSKREIIRAEITKRERLYGEFISECSKLLVDSLVRGLENPEPMLPVYALLNRIRVSASDPVLAEAEKIMVRITEQYFSPNLSVEDMRTLIHSGSDTDPLKPFGKACRTELKSMHAALWRYDCE